MQTLFPCSLPKSASRAVTSSSGSCGGRLRRSESVISQYELQRQRSPTAAVRKASWAVARAIRRAPRKRCIHLCCCEWEEVHVTPPLRCKCCCGQKTYTKTPTCRHPLHNAFSSSPQVFMCCSPHSHRASCCAFRSPWNALGASSTLSARSTSGAAADSAVLISSALGANGRKKLMTCPVALTPVHLDQA